MANTIETFNYILNHTNISNADTVLLTGDSAGGLATFNYADALNDLLPNVKNYAASPDSGYFINFNLPS